MRVSRVVLRKRSDRDIFHGERQVQVYCSVPFLCRGTMNRLVGTGRDWSFVEPERAANLFLWTIEQLTDDLYEVVVSDVVEVPPVLPTTDVDALVLSLLGPEVVVSGPRMFGVLPETVAV